MDKAQYRARLTNQVSKVCLEKDIENLLNKKTITVQRMRKKQIKQVDIRPFIDRIQTVDSGFSLTANIDQGKTVRMEEIMTLLFPNQRSLVQSAHVHREALWVESDGHLLSPLKVIPSFELHEKNM